MEEAWAEQKVLAEVIRGNGLAQEPPGKEELFLSPFNIQQYQMKSQDSWCPMMLIIQSFHRHIFHSTIQGFKETTKQYLIHERSLQNPPQHISSLYL